MLTQQTVGGRYTIHALIGRGGMGAVYRATDRLTGQQVALKQVTLSAEAGSSASPSHITLSPEKTFNEASGSQLRLALAQEFKTLSTLRHPHIISVLDYGFDAAQNSYFTMELLENAPTILAAGHGRSLSFQISLIIQLLQALTYLHRRGIIHRDLKPENVLYIDNHVKVVDFGLAVARQRLRDDSPSLAGTLAYMAPEVLSGRPATEAADLFSLGIIVYELLTGQHPFRAATTPDTLYNIVHLHADMWPISQVDPRLVPLMDALLHKEPALRLQNTDNLSERLVEVVGREDLLQERSEVRESFLQAAEFVGRTAELHLLSHALREATADRASAWLVVGESGVGKTRLLDELRTQALVDGVLVLRSQAVREGSAPYQVWQPILRRLCLETTLTEAEASIIQPLVPDIATLLGRPVPAAPPINDPQVAQGRLLQVIEGMLALQGVPLLIIVEDLQWAGSESLTILQRLAAAIQDGYATSLLLIASYRDDELSVNLNVPSMRQLKLGRLTRADIQTLAVAMLGPAVGQRPDLLDLLERETEGNAFFIVEVVRLLAEEAGQLNLVGNQELPQAVFTGGIRAVVDRRLNRVPRRARQLLSVAAIAGRQLDVRVLDEIMRRHYPALAPDGLEAWLTTCARAAVLDVKEQAWHFAHDKLREGLLVNLPYDFHQGLHRQVAEALEAVYEDRLPHAAALAYHWGEAGDQPRTAEYTALVGAQALRNGAYREAIHYLEQAQTLYREIPSPQLARATLARQLGGAYYGIGHFTGCGEQIELALQLMGQPLPRSRGQILRQIGREMAHQVWLMAQPRRTPPTAAAQAHAQEMARIYLQLTWVNIFVSHMSATIYTTLRGLNYALQAGPSPELTRLAVWQSTVSYLGRWPWLGRRYADLAARTAEAQNDMPGLGMFYYFRAYEELHFRGTWAEASRLLFRAMELLDQPIDKRQWLQAVIISTELSYVKGDLLQALSKASHAADMAQKQGDLQAQITAQLYEVLVYLRLGHADGARPLLATMQNLLRPSVGTATEIFCWSVLALAQWRWGQTAEALHSAAVALAHMRTVQPITPWIFDGYGAVCEVLLGAWAAGLVDDGAAAEQATRFLYSMGVLFPVFRARAFLWRGVYWYQRGYSRVAHWHWRHGLRLAKRFDLPFDEGLLRYQIGRSLPPTNGRRAPHLAKARALFERLDAAHEAELIKKLEE